MFFSKKLLKWSIGKLVFVERTNLIKLSITSIQYIQKITDMNKIGLLITELCYVKVEIYELLLRFIFD